jgi:two-component system, OmpR family, phosphate regulon sensor histidine kinase PhoR
MDPQKILYIDKRIVRTIRWVSLLFSLAFASLCLLVYWNVVKTPVAFTALCLPVAAALIVLGLLQVLWNPYTQAKVSAYIYCYIIAAIIVSTCIVGFKTPMFLAWLTIAIVADIYFSFRRALVVLVAMFLGLTIWVVWREQNLDTATISLFYASALGLAAITGVVSVVWRLTNDSVHNLEDSHTKQDFEHQQLSSLINSMADGVVAVDTAGQVILFNGAALEVLDRNGLHTGENINDVLTPIDTDDKPVDMWARIQSITKPMTDRDLRLNYSDGSIINLYVSIAPVHLGFGEQGQHGHVILLRDITREKSLEEERNEFISVVSHELRTPIAIAEGNISNAQFIAEKSGDMTAIKQALEEAHSQTLFLADMINDLSTLSRAERGVLTLDLEQVDIKELMTELANNYTPEAGKKGLSLSMNIDSGVGSLSSNKLYVREVLQNFITNAIKYTKEGGITLSVRQLPDGSAEFQVSDTGIGISKSDQARVFDKFFRSEDYRTRETNGTGLGLYVTAKLARLLHADISLRSTLNEGSTFTIVIPNITSAAQPVALAAEPAHQAQTA